MARHDHGDNHEAHVHGTSMSAKAALDPMGHSLRDYVPLIVVFAFILLASAVHVAVMGNTLENWMMAIMGYFFLFFALFKFIDLPGFQEGFRHYDILAQRLPVWGYVYPFAELALGSLFLLGNQSQLLLVATIIITLLNVVSVWIKLAKKEVFMCACLGTVLKVPLTTVTLIEYGLMGAMALWMLAR